MKALELINDSAKEIIEKVGSLFTDDYNETGILASVSMAQFILESGYGKSELAQNANNLFGMKKRVSSNTWEGSTWECHIYLKKTYEWDATGNKYETYAEFRSYDSMEQSIADHSAYLSNAKVKNNYRYEGLKDCTDYREAFTIIKNGGYSTDVNYVDKLCELVERWDLTRFDIKKEPEIVKPSQPTEKPIEPPKKQNEAKPNKPNIEIKPTNKKKHPIVDFLIKLLEQLRSI